VVEMMRSPFFLGVMGGTPGHALLFLKEREGFLGCLDPHQTRRAAESEEELLNSRKEYCGKLGWVRQEKISSSMGIAFVVERGRVGVFWEEMLAMRQRLGEAFFVYLADERPQYSEGDIEVIEMDEH
jgi:hypothetical protein